MGKKLFPVWVFLAVVAAGGLIFLIVHGLSGHYLTDQNEKSSGIKCEGTHEKHQVTITNNVLSPQHTDGKLCDTLTITNQDNRVRLIAFGEHDNHQPYDGVTEKALKKDESLTITFDETGSYLFHDHLQDEAQGNFTVR